MNFICLITLTCTGTPYIFRLSNAPCGYISLVKRIPWSIMCTNSHRMSEGAKINNKLLSIQQTCRNNKLTGIQSSVYCVNYHSTRMWANVQRDGLNAEYRWRPLFNAAVWLTPTTRVPCSNAAKTRNRWNYLGCPKLTKRSQPLVGQSSPYCGACRRYCCLTSFFFRLSIHALPGKI